jgi:hypothetical protein
MSNDNYVFKLALTEDVVSKGMVKLLEDFNIYGMTEEKAMKLFYSIMAHVMYHLEVHPGQYFKLKYIDIVNDKDNFICVKRNSDYSEDTVNPQMFYNRFCGTQVLKEELQDSLDLFARSFIGIRENKRREKKSVDTLIKRAEALGEEIRQCTDIMSKSDKQRKQVLKQRLADEKKVKTYTRKKEKSCFSSAIELRHREMYLKAYEELEHALIKQWEKDNTKFPF